MPSNLYTIEHECICVYSIQFNILCACAFKCIRSLKHTINICRNIFVMFRILHPNKDIHFQLASQSMYLFLKLNRILCENSTYINISGNFDISVFNVCVFMQKFSNSNKNVCVCVCVNGYSVSCSIHFEWILNDVHVLQ